MKKGTTNKRLHSFYTNEEMQAFKEKVESEILDYEKRIASDKASLRDLREDSCSDVADRASHQEISTRLSGQIHRAQSTLEVLQKRKMVLEQNPELFGKCINTHQYIPAEILLKRIVQAIMPTKSQTMKKTTIA